MLTTTALIKQSFAHDINNFENFNTLLPLYQEGRIRLARVNYFLQDQENLKNEQDFPCFLLLIF